MHRHEVQSYTDTFWSKQSDGAHAFLRLAITYAYGFGPQANGFANRWLRYL